MRIAVLALATILVLPLAAQTRWQSEIGIQGGYVRRDLAGRTDRFDRVDFYSIPGTDFSDASLGPGALFAVIPVHGRIALEPSFTFFQASPGMIGGTTVTLGLRADYAITAHAYVAAGGIMSHVDGVTGVVPPTTGGTPLALQAAVGYRGHLTNRLGGRVEAAWLSVAKNDLSPAANLYAVLIGLSASAARPRKPAAHRTGAWTPVLGIQGGYARSAFSFTSPIGTLTFPGVGAGSLIGQYGSLPPTFFLIIPLSNRFAVEPGFDLHQATEFKTCVTTQLVPRLDYAIGPWYAAAGPTLHVGKCRFITTAALAGVVGGAGAWGYRFNVAGALQGRVEVSYSATLPRHDPNYSTRTFGLMVGVMTPLN